MQRYTIIITISSDIFSSSVYMAYQIRCNGIDIPTGLWTGLQWNRYLFFIIVNAVHVSGGFSAHQQELKNCTHSVRYMPSLLAATASSSSKQAWHIPDAVCTFLELLMMGGETA